MAKLSDEERAETLAQALSILDIVDERDREAVTDDLKEYAKILIGSLETPKVSLKKLCDALDEIDLAAAKLLRLLKQYEVDLENSLASDPFFTLTEPIHSSIYGRKQFDLETLRELSVAANAVRSDLVTEFGNGDSHAPDKNGSDLHARLNGSAKRLFVFNVMSIFSAYRPDVLVSTRGGHAFKFVELCWIWATEGCEISGLMDDLAKIVPQYQVIRNRDEVRALENAAKNCRRLGLADAADDFQARADDLKNRTVRSSDPK